MSDMYDWAISGYKGLGAATCLHIPGRVGRHWGWARWRTWGQSRGWACQGNQMCTTLYDLDFIVHQMRLWRKKRQERAFLPTAVWELLSSVQMKSNRDGSKQNFKRRWFRWGMMVILKQCRWESLSFWVYASNIESPDRIDASCKRSGIEWLKASACATRRRWVKWWWTRWDLCLGGSHQKLDLERTEFEMPMEFWEVF